MPDAELDAAAAAHLELARTLAPGGYAALKRMLVELGQPDTATPELAAFETLMRERGQ